MSDPESKRLWELTKVNDELLVALEACVSALDGVLDVLTEQPTITTVRDQAKVALSNAKQVQAN